MSFDLFLQVFRAGNAATVDRARVSAVLHQHRYDAPDKFSFYRVHFPDGSDVDFSASGLESDDEFDGCAFHIYGFTPSIVNFIFDVAKAGEMVILNAQGSNTLASPTFILTDQSQSAELPEDAGACPVVCHSAEHLSELLGLGFENWKDYRNTVVGGIKARGN